MRGKGDTDQREGESQNLDRTRGKPEARHM